MNDFTHEVLVWQDDFATGVPEIDEQHMILVHTLNEAGETLRKDASMAVFERITQDLLSYALYHFDTEEGLMQEYAYNEQSREEATRHQEQHRAFSTKVLAVRDSLKAGVKIPPGEILAFLNEWLVNHIQNTDKLLAKFIIAKRTGIKNTQ
jgi:hemerythrin-like metal-binding protein